MLRMQKKKIMQRRMGIELITPLITAAMMIYFMKRPNPWAGVA